VEYNEIVKQTEKFKNRGYIEINRLNDGCYVLLGRVENSGIIHTVELCTDNDKPEFCKFYKGEIVKMSKMFK